MSVNDLNCFFGEDSSKEGKRSDNRWKNAFVVERYDGKVVDLYVIVLRSLIK